MNQNVYGRCERCQGEVHGDIITTTGELADGTFVISQVGTPDRDWIVCDSCNALWCRNCCSYPAAGYCDDCVQRYKLYGLLIEMGAEIVFCDECRKPMCPKSCTLPESHLCDNCLDAVVDSFTQGGDDVH